MGIFSVIFGILGTIGSMILGIASFILYIFSAIGFHRLAKREGISYGWIAWIPVLQLFLLGKLIGNKLWGIEHADWILLLAPIAISILGSIFDNSFVISALSLVYYVYTVCAYYKLFELYSPANAMIFTITGAIISPLMGVYAFLIRDNPRRAIVK